MNLIEKFNKQLLDVRSQQKQYKTLDEVVEILNSLQNVVCNVNFMNTNYISVYYIPNHTKRVKAVTTPDELLSLFEKLPFFTIQEINIRKDRMYILVDDAAYISYVRRLRIKEVLLS
jgi:hypothetical protein